MARVFQPKDAKKSEGLDCFDMADDPDKCLITMKGAPDILIKNCKWVVNDDGSQAPLDDAALARLKEIQNQWCLLGQRVLLICKKNERVSQLKSQGFGASPAAFETYLKELKDLCVLGMVGIIDKPRDGIEGVIRICRQVC